MQLKDMPAPGAARSHCMVAADARCLVPVAAAVRRSSTFREAVTQQTYAQAARRPSDACEDGIADGPSALAR